MVLPWEPLHNPWVQLILSIPVYAVGLWFFGRSAYHSLKGGVPNMDVLIFIGAAASLFYSVYGTFAFAGTHEVHLYLFYETGASIICFVLLGNLLEKRSIKKTTSALHAITALQVKTALLIVDHNGHSHQEEVTVDSLKKGDILQVNTGSKIPIDSVVTKGEAECDESLLTGESMPVSKKSGDKVIGGTLLLNGNLQVRVESLLKESVLSQIIEMVKKAQGSKPQIQKLGDRVSAIFVPIVLVISLITFLFSYFYLDLGSAQSMLRAVAVLVISCPCAMGLATPTAIMVGIGKAARRGIIIKGGEVLENFAKSKTILFDKTGTLTTGAFEFAELNIIEGDTLELKNIIFHLESHSSHPIAKSLVQQKATWNAKPLNFVSTHEIKGIGMEAVLPNGTSVLFGSAHIAPNMDKNDDLFLLLNQKLVASIKIKDTLKYGATELIVYLKDEDFETILLSGDKQQKVDQIQNVLKLSHAFAEQMPAQKLQYIESRLGGLPLVMVGDGINDAPALSKVSVGISFSKATDIATQAANLVLMRQDISAIEEAHIISKQTYKTIKQNLFWAFFYNVLCIPLAAAGFLHPMLGALSMALSDVVVIGNSLLLGIKKVKSSKNLL